MVKKRAYTSSKQWLDKPQCGGSSPPRGTNATLADVVIAAV